MTVKIKTMKNPDKYVAEDSCTYRVLPDKNEKELWRLERISEKLNIPAYEGTCYMLSARRLATELRRIDQVKTLVMTKATYDAVCQSLSEPTLDFELTV